MILPHQPDLGYGLHPIAIHACHCIDSMYIILSIGLEGVKSRRKSSYWLYVVRTGYVKTCHTLYLKHDKHIPVIHHHEVNH